MKMSLLNNEEARNVNGGKACSKLFEPIKPCTKAEFCIHGYADYCVSHFGSPCFYGEFASI
ncbi:MAG: hypothetical protein J5520_07850 [Bacteroidales bacterium]|jgi:hypothetical protein|nr:hypothetical protein [Bacteroidales bacterium]MDT3356834.1 hypothetical protein [Bacteroidota bacterium]